MTNRIGYFDTIRYLAALWIFTTHFIASFASSFSVYWTVMPYSLLLNGVTGKLAVTVFCVVCGCLSYKSGQKNTDTFQYVIRRYLYYFAMAFFCNTLYVFFMNLGMLSLISEPVGIIHLFKSSILLRDDIVGLFWCLRPLLYGSIFCFINGKYNLSIQEILMQSAILFVMKQTWVSIVLLGNLAVLLLQKEKANVILKSSRIQILLMLAVFILIKRPENNITYFIDGVCMMAVVLIIANNGWIRSAMENKWLQKFNKFYMGVFLNHSLIYNLIGNFIFSRFTAWGHDAQLIIAYFLSLILIILLSCPFVFIVEKLAGLLSRCAEWCQTRCRNILIRSKI